MKIIHFSTNDNGGAGITAYRIHKECKNNLIDSVMYVSAKTTMDSTVVKVGHKSLIKKNIDRVKNRLLSFFINNNNLFFSLNIKSNLLSKKDLRNIISDDIDIIVIHWVAGFFDINELSQVINVSKTKVVFSLMDMASLTGGCHFSYSCTDYKRGCYSCNESKSTFIVNKIRNNFYEKVRFNLLTKATAIASSDFLLNQARESAIPFYSYNLIKPPISNEFHYFNNASKKVKRLLIGAYNKDDNRKGYLTLLLAMGKLSILLNKVNLTLDILVPSNDFEDDFSSFENISLCKYSFAKNDKELAELYNQADLFVNTSIDDSGPMMIQESLFCGIPVIATRTGVAEELFLDNKELGLVVDVFDYDDLAVKIFDALYHDALVKGEHIELKSKKIYSTKYSYSDLFKKVGEEKKS
jgi:glycosyltransferase involved in cell wall biosynthesis